MSDERQRRPDAKTGQGLCIECRRQKAVTPDMTCRRCDDRRRQKLPVPA